MAALKGRVGRPLAPPTRTVEVVVQGVPRPRGLRRLTGFCSRALEQAGYAAWHVRILLCGDERIAGLNERYRGKSGPTDVLSFPDQEGRQGEPVEGDIAVSLPTLARNAARYGVTENDEMKRLLVHGLLHLAGMDHGKGKGPAMLARQARLLARLGSDVIYGEKQT
ncbi:MAG TPA: rRNA maturation RNase YbeY [Spirochaetia bacterium]|nr:rRNA maturation RNase YbeY [Spirochaetia bacterium]